MSTTFRSEPFASFSVIAPFYDELMAPVGYDMWVSYYLLLLSQQDVRPKRVLDVACGTGTMCELLSAEGMTMSGFDLSFAMIEEARRKAAAKGLEIDYHVADATTFDLPKTHDAAYSFFDSLNNILDPDGLSRVFERVAAHLPSGASWIFDLNTPYAFEARLFDQEDMRRKAPLRYLWTSRYDAETMICEVDMRFWKDGRSYREVHRQRAHETDDVIDRLERAGFREIRVYHSYTLERPRPKSDRLHFSALVG